MATPKQVMDFRPSKGITTAQSNEHQRRWTEKGCDPLNQQATTTAAVSGSTSRFGAARFVL